MYIIMFETLISSLYFRKGGRCQTRYQAEVPCDFQLVNKIIVICIFVVITITIITNHDIVQQIKKNQQIKKMISTNLPPPLLDQHATIRTTSHVRREKATETELKKSHLGLNIVLMGGIEVASVIN